MNEFAAARLNMIESQVRPNGITDRRIIAAMESIAREDFVPESRRAIAYVDEDVPLTNGRCLIEAMAFARLLQHAAIAPSDRVLIVGAASGYGAAVVSALSDSAVALESDAELAALARGNLAGRANVTVVEGALSAGAAAQGPYNVIVFEGRAEEIPAAMFNQLSDGGRLVAVVGTAEMSKANVYTKSGQAVAVREVFDASVAALPGFAKQKPAFVF